METVLPERRSESVYGTGGAVVDTPRSVSQVSGKQLKIDILRSSDDLVKYAPGVSRGGGQNVNITPNIRGQGSEVLQDGQLIDGTRHPFNLNAYEGADIVAGTAPVMFGPVNASGGYTNYIAKKPRFDQTGTEVRGLLGSWVPKGGSWRNERLSIDSNFVFNDKLAIRGSVTAQRGGDYYKNIENNFNAFYGALAWKPSAKFRLDWNASYDDYYDFNITHGWNRPTQRLVDTYGKEYDAGRATPIIETAGTGLWSPVFASGDPNSEIIGWQRRTKDARGKFVADPTINTTPLPNAEPGTPGTIRGWVYDPNVPGNDKVAISPRDSARAEDINTASRFQTQGRGTLELTRELSLVGRLLLARSTDSTNSVGSFLNQQRRDIVDVRVELQHNDEHDVFGLKLKHDSNSGVAFRRNTYRFLGSILSFNINPYDLTQNPSGKTPGGLLGLPNASAATGSWIGTPGVPQQTDFGYLNIPAQYPVGSPVGELYAEPGGLGAGRAPGTAQGWWNTWTIFTQQNLLLHEHFGVNLGVRQSYIRAYIENPLILGANDAYTDEQSFSQGGLQVSPLVKPTKNSTVYFTYDRSSSVNSSGQLSFGQGNRLNPKAFESIAKLFEAGAKADLIPDHLFASAAIYRQERDQSPDINGNMARLETRGVEASVRYQSDVGFSGGLNFGYVKPVFTYIVPAGFSPYGFQPDNETVFGDRNALNQRTGTEYDAAGIPNWSFSGLVDYTFPFGLGAQLTGWLTGPWYTALSQDVKVPTEYNLDLTVYFRQPIWDVALSITNLTDSEQFVNGLPGSATEFLQPGRPLALQLQGGVRF